MTKTEKKAEVGKKESKINPLTDEEQLRLSELNLARKLTAAESKERRELTKREKLVAKALKEKSDAEFEKLPEKQKKMERRKRLIKARLSHEEDYPKEQTRQWRYELRAMAMGEWDEGMLAPKTKSNYQKFMDE